ncbi:MAG: trypsin-like peptidase domain-containing protein [Candidatus Izemoplasmatales bacterium]|jgi:S1-C subfamily serine protease|nr:trypsin-like peptidase domain-containing protein [bacterium]MDZ4197357.1 trypsin-like peptidase domain-containing protein [Candidatus Izemoplasmatales bacterium]
MISMIKRSLSFLLLGLVFFLVGCTGFRFEFSWPNEYNSYTTTIPATFNGTLSINEADYELFATYISPTSSLTSVSEYNARLMETRNHIRRANIKIVTTLTRTVPIFPGSKTTFEQIMGSASGSGVVYKSDELYYYAITNFHVIDAKDYNAKYQVQAFNDADDATSLAELLAYDESLDLAIIRFPKNSRTDVEMINIETRKFTKFSSGELVLAVGNPQGIDFNVTFGEFIRLSSIQNASFKVIYHSAMIHEGSSGGALVDIDGNLIGINTWGSAASDEDSFAIPHYIIYEFIINNGLR